MMMVNNGHVSSDVSSVFSDWEGLPHEEVYKIEEMVLDRSGNTNTDWCRGQHGKILPRRPEGNITQLRGIIFQCCPQHQPIFVYCQVSFNNELKVSA